MGKKEEYKEKNLRFLEEVAAGEGVVKLPCGVMYKEIEKGTGLVSPGLTDVVSVHYRGTLANGISPQSGDRRMARGASADACGGPLDDLYPLYFRVWDAYIRPDPRLFYAAV